MAFLWSRALQMGRIRLRPAADRLAGGIGRLHYDVPRKAFTPHSRRGKGRNMRVVGQTKAVKRRGIALSDWGCEEAPP